jgi:IS4 transposase
MNRVCSIFNQLLQLFPRLEFEQAVARHRGERHARGFTCWGQFLAMLFCQIGQAKSLREICGGLASSEGKLQHLGLPEAPKRSTLAYANKHRPWQLFAEVFQQLQNKCGVQIEQRNQTNAKKFQFRHRLMSIDASLIFLCEKAIDWGEYHRGKGALKMHVLLDHEGYLPRLAVMSGPNQPEVTVARNWRFARGTVLLVDKGYVDYRWYDRLCEDGVWFVTRLRRQAYYEVVEQRAVTPGSGVLRDQLIRLGAQKHRLRNLLRLVEVERAGEQPMVLLTNHLRWEAGTVVALYRERWRIEQFFRALKQNLRVKTFVGTSANAILIQIWTALIAILLLKYLMLLARYGWSLANLVAMLRMQLFVYRDLRTWLNEPFHPPPLPEYLAFQQLRLCFERE